MSTATGTSRNSNENIEIESDEEELSKMFSKDEDVGVIVEQMEVHIKESVETNIVPGR